eukprot:9650693-Ditylum_brightwellii.AAC.1
MEDNASMSTRCPPPSPFTTVFVPPDDCDGSVPGRDVVSPATLDVPTLFVLACCCDAGTTG